MTTNLNLILDGDATSHGGKVIVKDKRATISGKKIACIGDDVYCPKCRGIYPIITNDNVTQYMGLTVATEGNKTGCGAHLISSQQVVSIK